jgi:nicotinate (nicotinamide) nucleotide adenylyltransferase
VEVFSPCLRCLRIELLEQTDVTLVNGIFMKKTIALLGAAFDPLHYAHAALAIVTLKYKLADEVWLIPSPHRWDKSPVASAERRLLWAHLAAQNLQKLGYSVVASDTEIRQGDYRGTYYLLTQLQNLYPEFKFKFILGEDAYRSIPLWRDPIAKQQNGNLLLKEGHFLLAPRKTQTSPLHVSMPNVEMLPALHEEDQKICPLLGCNSMSNLSSTMIREQFAKQEFHAVTFEDILKDIQLNNPYLGNQAL